MWIRFMFGLQGKKCTSVVIVWLGTQLRAEQHAAQVQQQLQEANGIKDMMEQQAR